MLHTAPVEYEASSERRPCKLPRQVDQSWEWYPVSEAISSGGGALQQPGEQPVLQRSTWSSACAVQVTEVCMEHSEAIYQHLSNNGLDSHQGTIWGQTSLLVSECAAHSFLKKESSSGKHSIKVPNINYIIVTHWDSQSQIDEVPVNKPQPGDLQANNQQSTKHTAAEHWVSFQPPVFL